MHIKHLFLLIFVLTSSAANAENELTIIKLKSRTAEEIIPLIKPFINPHDTITGMGNQLIIRTSPEGVSDIHKILEKFDRPPRRLVIYLRQGHLTDDKQRQISTGIRADIGRHVTVEAGDQTKNNSMRLRARTHHRERDHETLQHIQTLEGEAAFIATGKLIPIQEHSAYISNGAMYQQQTTRFQDARTGFYVTPRLNENRVTLQISPFMNRSGQTNGSLETQQASTTLSGRLGEWIAVAGSHQNHKQRGAGLARFQSTQVEDSRQIYLRIEELVQH